MYMQDFKARLLFAIMITVAFFIFTSDATAGKDEKQKTEAIKAVTTLLKDVKKIAVLDFEGYEQEYAGQAVAGDLIAKLQSLGQLEVLERAQIKQVLAEHSLSMTGVVDPKTAKELGNMLGAEALIMGSVLVWTSEEKEVMKDDWSTMKIDPVTNAVSVSKTPHMYRKAYVKVSIRVANVETGVVQVAGAYEKGVTQEERMTDSYKKMRTKEQLIQECVDNITSQFIASITPPKVENKSTSTKKNERETPHAEEAPKIQFYNGGSKYFKEASKFAMRQLWPEAKELWEKAAAESQDKENKKDIAGAHYNLGLYYEAARNYSRAEQEYKAAYETDNKDNYLDRLSTVRKEWGTKGGIEPATAAEEPPAMNPPTDTVRKKEEKDPYCYGASKYFKEGSKFAVRQLWPEAKEAWEKSLSQSQEKENKKDIASAHYNLGLYYLEVSNYGTAEQEFKAAYESDSKDQFLDRLAEARLKHEAQVKIEKASKKETPPFIGPPADTTSKIEVKKKKVRRKKI